MLQISHGHARVAHFTFYMVEGDRVMRQIGDTLVWLAMITVIAAVVYFTPRLASYVTSMSNEHAVDYVSSAGSLQLTHEDTSVQTP